MTISAFTKVHHFNGGTYREVPGYKNIAVSENGKAIRLTDNGNPFRVLELKKYHNTKAERRGETTYYLNVSAKHETKDTKTVGVHILVCMAWNGMPPSDGKRYDVNHKNSIKIDNQADNLEWTTRSQNISHCFDSGENAAAIRIIAKNMETGEEKIFRSIKNFASIMGLHRVDVRRFISKHTEHPHKGWTYKIEDPREFRFAAKKYQTREVAYKDYVANTITFVKSIEEASLKTGILSVTIRVACDRRRNGGTERPTKQYFFQYLEAGMKWPEFTKGELEGYEEEFTRRSMAMSFPRKQKNIRFPSTEM